MKKELQDKIQNISFQMFRDWTANAKEKYPDYDFTIIDETILVTNLTSSIQSAVNTLKKRSKNLKDKLMATIQGLFWALYKLT